MMFVRLPFILALVVATPAFALDCKDGGTTQNDMDACAGQAFKASDALLNKRYDAVRACLDEKGKKTLLEAQKAWLKMRDADCDLQSSASEGGSVQPMVRAMCLQAETDQRSKNLNYYLTCEEGDASCPTPHCRVK